MSESASNNQINKYQMEVLMELKQKPVIEHQLEKVGKEIKEKLDSLNISNQVVTADTIKAVKAMRAEVRSMLAEYEDSRKLINTACSTPYKTMLEHYNKYIKEPCSNADVVLKKAIDDYEDVVRDEKKKTLTTYFDELVDSFEIDFLKFSSMNIEINLSTTENKYKSLISEFVKNVSSEIDHIKTLEFSDEILIEYKKSLNAVSAITVVQKRKAELKKIEEEKALALKNYKVNALVNAGLLLDKDTSTFEFDDELYFPWSDFKLLEKESFDLKMIEIKKKISEKIELEKEVVSPEVKAPEVIKAPVVSKAPGKKVSAVFHVSAPYPVLKRLSEFMKDNNIDYTNVDDENYQSFFNV